MKGAFVQQYTFLLVTAETELFLNLVLKILAIVKCEIQVDSVINH